MSDIRQHNTYDSQLTSALMKEHADDWDMETVREAALICSNTLIPIIEDKERAAANSTSIAIRRLFRPGSRAWLKIVDYRYKQGLTKAGKGEV